MKLFSTAKAFTQEDHNTHSSTVHVLQTSIEYVSDHPAFTPADLLCSSSARKKSQMTEEGTPHRPCLSMSFLSTNSDTHSDDLRKVECQFLFLGIEKGKRVWRAPQIRNSDSPHMQLHDNAKCISIQHSECTSRSDLVVGALPGTALTGLVL